VFLGKFLNFSSIYSESEHFLDLPIAFNSGQQLFSLGLGILCAAHYLLVANQLVFEGFGGCVVLDGVLKHQESSWERKGVFVIIHHLFCPFLELLDLGSSDGIIQAFNGSITAFFSSSKTF